MSMIVLAVVSIVFALMLIEGWHSRRNERGLRARGAVEPERDVYTLMRVAYPGAFVAMAVEGWWREPRLGAFFWTGAAMFAAGKVLKYWAIATLGDLWTFRVLVLPRHPRVRRGPYRFVRHPNYVGVVGELLGVALMVQAPVTGAVALAGFAWVLARRTAVEGRALEATWGPESLRGRRP